MANTDFAPYLGPKIKRIRQKVRKRQQKDVAAEVGCSQPTLSVFESGKADPSLDLLRRICEALDLRLLVDVVDFASAERTYTGPLPVVEIARGVEVLPAELRHITARLVALLPHLPEGHRQVIAEMIGGWERSHMPRPARPGDQP